jgi:hypothetical protein
MKQNVSVTVDVLKTRFSTFQVPAGSHYRDDPTVRPSIATRAIVATSVAVKRRDIADEARMRTHRSVSTGVTMNWYQMTTHGHDNEE